MDDIVAFLTTRLDEDELDATALHELDCQMTVRIPSCDCGYPARVLREVEAKRRIVAEHKPFLDHVEWPHDQTGDGKAFVCPRCQNAENDSANWRPLEGEAGKFPFESFVVPYVLAPCPTVRALAAVYADHPDYRDDWRL